MNSPPNEEITLGVAELRLEMSDAKHGSLASQRMSVTNRSLTDMALRMADCVEECTFTNGRIDRITSCAMQIWHDSPSHKQTNKGVCRLYCQSDGLDTRGCLNNVVRHTELGCVLVGLSQKLKSSKSLAGEILDNPINELLAPSENSSQPLPLDSRGA